MKDPTCPRCKKPIPPKGARCNLATVCTCKTRMVTRDWKNEIFNLCLAADERIKDPDAFRSVYGSAYIEVSPELMLAIIADLEALECIESTGKWPHELDAEEKKS